MADRLQPGDHVCWVVDEEVQVAEAVAGYVAGGLRAGSKVLYFAQDLVPAALIAMLEERGVEASQAVDKGQMTVTPASAVYLPDGTFKSHRTASWVADAIRAAKDEGWAGVRILSEMGWAAAGHQGWRHLVEYEADLNQLFVDGYATAVCAYDRRLFTHAEVDDVMTAHPGTIGSRDMEDWSQQLRISRTVDPVGLRLCGEVDVSNHRALEAVLRAIAAEADHQVINIDVAELRFADLGAVRLLIRAAEASNADLRLVGCSQMLVWLLDVVAAGRPIPGLVVKVES